MRDIEVTELREGHLKQRSMLGISLVFSVGVAGLRGIDNIARGS